MSFAPVFTKVRAVVTSGFTAWPVKWPNERLTGYALDEGAKPIGADGRKISFVEYEQIGGRTTQQSFGSSGNRVERSPGLLRFYFLVPEGEGTSEAISKADTMGSLFELQEFRLDDGTMLITYEPSVSQNVAGVEDGSYWVLMLSIPYDYYYSA